VGGERWRGEGYRGGNEQRSAARGGGTAGWRQGTRSGGRALAYTRELRRRLSFATPPSRNLVRWMVN